MMVEFPKDVRNRFCLSHQTSERLRIAGFLNLSSNTGNMLIYAKETGSGLAVQQFPKFIVMQKPSCLRSL